MGEAEKRHEYFFLFMTLTVVLFSSYLVEVFHQIPIFSGILCESFQHRKRDKKS